MSWHSCIDPAQPYWSDYLPYIQQLKHSNFPSCTQLNALLPAGLRSKGGQAICFTSSTELTDTAYEQRIYATGQVSTRPGNWHDLFNALVWARFPQIKAAMNTLHHGAFTNHQTGSRGQLRDALTLFDECGVIIFSHHPELLEALAQRRWRDLFQDAQYCWHLDIQLAICGHAILEKYLSPYKSMTAKALLVLLEPACMDISHEEMLQLLDSEIARGMLASEILTRPACLTPLPLAGVPGWWPVNQNHPRFYDDPEVFRLPPACFDPAPVYQISKRSIEIACYSSGH